MVKTAQKYIYSHNWPLYYTPGYKGPIRNSQSQFQLRCKWHSWRWQSNGCSKWPIKICLFVLIVEFCRGTKAAGWPRWHLRQVSLTFFLSHFLSKYFCHISFPIFLSQFLSKYFCHIFFPIFLSQFPSKYVCHIFFPILLSHFSVQSFCHNVDDGSSGSPSSPIDFRSGQNGV